MDSPFVSNYPFPAEAFQSRMRTNKKPHQVDPLCLFRLRPRVSPSSRALQGCRVDDGRTGADPLCRARAEAIPRKRRRLQATKRLRTDIFSATLPDRRS